MAGTSLNEQDWQVRLFIYNFFVEHGQPPTTQETAEHFGLSEEQTQQIYQRLHDFHTLFLDPGTTNVRIANPMSAIPTGFVVFVNNQPLWANCAWDSLGIPAMLSKDAVIEATNGLTGEKLSYAIKDGVLVGDSGVVHFPLPFTNWYDDLIYT